MTIRVRLGQLCRSAESSGAASMTCSRLSRRRSNSRSPMCAASPSLAPSICAILLGDEGRVAESSQPDPEDACLVAPDERRRGLDRQPGLARATRAGERHEARSALDPREHVGKLLLPPHEGARRTGQVGVRDRLERREEVGAELEDGHRLRRCPSAGARRDRSARRRRAPLSSSRARPGRRDPRRRRERRSGRRGPRTPRRLRAGFPCAARSAAESARPRTAP